MPTDAGGLAEPVPEEAGEVVFDVNGLSVFYARRRRRSKRSS